MKREESLIQTDTMHVRIMELLLVILATTLAVTVVYVFFYERFAHEPGT